MRILLVEDNSDHRELMHLALTGYGSTWEVEAVASGEEALRLVLGGEVFDLVFLDYSLPGRDGLEVLEEIRRGEAPPPVVVVTGRGDEQLAVKAMKGGAYDYVVKGEGYLQRLPVVAQRAVEAHQLAVERKRAEKALRENEERLRTVVEASLDAIIAVNVEGRLVLFNDAAQELFQYSEEEALNQPADILLREEIGKIHQERLERFLKRGVGQCGHIGRRVERFFRRKDGSLFEGEVSMSGGRLDGLRLVVLAIHDITSRKRAEEELRESEEKYRNILENIEDGYFEVDLAGNFTFFNPSLCRILGYPREEMPGMNNRVFMDAENAKKVFRAFNEVYVTGIPVKGFEWETIRKDDARRTYIEGSVSLIARPGEKPTGFRGIARDITERKRTQEALRESETHYRILAENATDVIWTVGMDMRLTYVSPSVTMLLGFTVEEAMARTMQQAYTPEAFEKAMQIFAEEMAIESAGHGDPTRSRMLELELVRKDGNTVPAEGNFCALRDPTGKMIGILSILRDITERKRMEEALRDSEKRYRELSIVDGLTTLYNSRHFYVQLKNELERSNRHEQPLTLLLLDIDNFKAFNDTYGHIEGDQVLRRLGQVVKRCLRQTDSAYRYGGEEFTIILPMTTSADGSVTAERIRTEFKKENFSPAPGQEFYLTVSIGLSQYKPKEDIKAFVHRVDQLMYQAKKNGKDRVCSEL